MKPIRIREDYLVFDKHLVISDLHIGLEEYFREKGYNSPNQDITILKKIEKIIKKIKIEKLIILGDLKETITHASDYERLHIRILLKKLRNYFKEIIIVKGNHDGNIEKIGIRTTPYYVHNKILFAHGHKNIPEKPIANEKIERIVIGHAHNMYKIKDKNGISYQKPCWLVGKYLGIETIVVPSFSDLVTGKHYRSKKSGPVVKKLKNKEIFLEDMTKVK